MAKVTAVQSSEPTFDDIKMWYENNMSPHVIDLNDQEAFKVYSEGRHAGIFQLTSKGAQQLFKKARPTSVIDIAALTSIYRPGPLAAHVDKLWLKHEVEPYDWGHPLINSTLKETRGLLVFQEGVMALVNKVSGFPLSETDEVRRAIMKRSISGGEAAKKKMKELEDSIVAGAVKNGVPEATARKMYETICFMSGYGFNKCVTSDTEVNTYSQEGEKATCKLIKNVLPGDLVMSREEKTKRNVLVPVKAVHRNGKKKVVKVTLTTGEVIKCTLDHKFRTLETGEMLPLEQIMKLNLSIVVHHLFIGA